MEGGAPRMVPATRRVWRNHPGRGVTDRDLAKGGSVHIAPPLGAQRTRTRAGHRHARGSHAPDSERMLCRRAGAGYWRRPSSATTAVLPWRELTCPTYEPPPSWHARMASTGSRAVTQPITCPRTPTRTRPSRTWTATRSPAWTETPLSSGTSTSMSGQT